jgi:hypothetical protein
VHHHRREVVGRLLQARFAEHCRLVWQHSHMTRRSPMARSDLPKGALHTRRCSELDAVARRVGVRLRRCAHES